MNHNSVMVKIKGNKERITKIRHGMIGHHERVKIHVKNGKMLHILHPASKGHQLGTCTLNGFRSFNPNTQVQAEPPNGAQLNGKTKHIEKSLDFRQKIKNKKS